MAEARDIEGLSPETPFAEAGAAVVETRAAELLEHSGGVLEIGEIEGLHDMRVATRRLRAALEVFAPCFPRDEHRAALKEVKRIADALGERRDRDVAIAALARFAEGMPSPDRPGIRSLIARYEEEQRAANEALEPYVAEKRLAALRDALAGLVEAARGSAEPRTG